MLYGFLLSIFLFNGFLIMLIILIQQSKGSLGLGAMGGGQQVLFGGSGGQELLQKITWILGTIFLLGSLILAIMKSTGTHDTRYLGKQAATLPIEAPQPTPAPETPQPMPTPEKTTPQP